MTPDHLEQLQKQREIIRRHLAWLDAEIAREKGSGAFATNSGIANLAATPATEDQIVSSKVPDTEAEETKTVEPLPDLDPRDVHDEVRRGCLVYVAIAVTLGLALIGFIYWRY